MSRTLFWYVFKDLLLIFFMASGSLAGIMSFGGLLRPLTQNGLDGAQILLLIRYSMPAMSTYSLPVAALFATTWVYGRMAADNEITACRACGISFIAMSTPAMLLGLLVAVMSMYMLCFTVPINTLKIERVIVSNIAKIVVHQIEQGHETHFGYFTVYAEDAHLLEPMPDKPNRQAVLMRGPMIVSFNTPPNKDKYFNVAKEFYMAREAVAYIDQNMEEGTAQLTVVLSDGVLFPRRFTGPKSEQGGLGVAQFGPVDLPSRLNEKTKFMDIFQLKELDRDPSRGRDVRAVTAQFIAEDQSGEFTRRLVTMLNGPQQQWSFQNEGETNTIIRPADASVSVRGSTITIRAAAKGKPILLKQESGGQVRLTAEARSLEIKTEADTARDQLIVSLDLQDVLVDAGETKTPKAGLPRKFVLPMPADIAGMKTRTTEVYLNSSVRGEAQQQQLWYAWINLINHVRSEMHARAAFVISCVLLVIVGACLGMMFRSGNFLTAFAVSVVPAMLSVVLIVTGQHTAENVPKDLGGNPLNAGIAIIWTGNVIVFIAAVVLLGRLQREVAPESSNGIGSRLRLRGSARSAKPQATAKAIRRWNRSSGANANMKILDRYVLILFLKNYVISLAVLIGLYVVMDMVFNFDHLVSVQATSRTSGLNSALSVVRDVVDYYFYQSFMIFVQLSGIIPVVAAAFTLLRLSRFGELTAFLAAGVPLLRITVAIIVASALLNVLLLVDQEFVLPHMIPKLTRKHEEVHTAAVPYFSIRSMQVDQRSLLVAARFWPAFYGRPARMEELDVIERDDNLRPISHLFAKSAEWDAERQEWRLTDGWQVSNLLPMQQPTGEQSVQIYHGDVTPEEIALYHSSEFVDLLSTRRINELIERPKSYGVVGLYKVKHLRITQPFMNFFLLLLAIPTVLTHDPKTLKSAATKCLTLTGLAMGTVFLCTQIASYPPGNLSADSWTLLWAAVPIFIFAPISVWLLDRVKS